MHRFICINTYTYIHVMGILQALQPVWVYLLFPLWAHDSVSFRQLSPLCLPSWYGFFPFHCVFPQKMLANISAKIISSTLNMKVVCSSRLPLILTSNSKRCLLCFYPMQSQVKDPHSSGILWSKLNIALHVCVGGISSESLQGRKSSFSST